MGLDKRFRPDNKTHPKNYTKCYKYQWHGLAEPLTLNVNVQDLEIVIGDDEVSVLALG